MRKSKKYSGLASISSKDPYKTECVMAKPLFEKTILIEDAENIICVCPCGKDINLKFNFNRKTHCLTIESASYLYRDGYSVIYTLNKNAKRDLAIKRILR